ncbi:MAG TPA: glycosyltransferase family 2 protein [Halanaerobiales bacterium]|nr:glycosyltransferase family 2 protein [Halanaerobiales bacterium]
MRLLNYLIDFFLITYIVYFLFFVLMGFFTRKNREFKKPEKRFAIIIPAHNEEKVIAKLIQNLKKLDYPKHLYDIFVVADNCKDNTAKIARSQQVNVMVRLNNEKKAKGYALKYAFEKLGFISGKAEYDAVSVFDADNLVEENFLKAMNTRLLKGEKIIQAYIDSKNPDDNWVTATFSMMFWINDRYNLLSRYNINLSSVLMGTGMCISAKTLEQIGWNTVTLTEDLEYSVQALMNGIKTSFARETKIYDEKPISFKASCRQRLRWARGQLSVALKYAARLVIKGIKKRNIAIFDGGFRILQQPFIMFYTATTLFRLLLPDLFGSPLFNMVLENLKILGFILPITPFLLPASVFILDKLSFKSFKYIIFFPLFMYSWVAILYWALLTLNKKDWLPTKHSRSISKKDLIRESTYAS